MQKQNAKAITPRAKLEPQTRVRLQLETGCDSGTIRRWEKGEPVKPATHLRLVKGCSKLGIEVLV